MRPEWEIEKQEFLNRLGVSEADFEKSLCLPDTREVSRIVPLRHMGKIESLIPISYSVLLRLISKMTTLDGQRPFTQSSIELCKVDPNTLEVGQKFVYRENYQSILEDVPCLFGKFLIASGVSDLGAYFVFGLDKDDLVSLACYVPPIVEQHGASRVIMDGIHRTYTTKQLGATITSILIKNIDVDFPCGARPWKDVRVISLKDKPQDINDRYFKLRKELFRDLKYLGIDG